MTTASVERADERARFIQYLRTQAAWRQAKAADFPDDDRNERAALLYELLAGWIEDGEFADHPIFDVFALWPEGGLSVMSRSLGRLGFEHAPEHLHPYRTSVQKVFFDSLLHDVAISEYIEALESMGQLDGLQPLYVPDALTALGYIDDSHSHIVKPLPALEIGAREIIAWAEKWDQEHPLGVARDKALAVGDLLTQFVQFLDEPRVRKQLAAAGEAEVKELISELAMISSRASVTAARLVNRHSRTKYLS